LQWIGALALGDGDLQDDNELRHDPLRALLVEKPHLPRR
jgi:hypothetical protein